MELAKQQILLAVTGMSPQVITETLYGLIKAQRPWPTAIHVITTNKGAAIIRDSLILGGWLESLCREYDMPVLGSDQVTIAVVPDADGHEVDDVRTKEDQAALSDFIMSTVQRFTSDPNTAVHASIAGGRKTMTFYLGYAMSLFGRPQDWLSHVLVSDGYESLPDFFYPTRNSRRIETYDGRTLDAKDATVELAEIPFIRQRDELPELMLSEERPVDFSLLVDLVNLGHKPEAINIELHEQAMQLVVLNGEQELQTVEFKNRVDWTLYLMIAEATIAGDPSMRRPSDKDPDQWEVLAWRLLRRLADSLGLSVSESLPYKDELERWLREYEEVLEEAGIRPTNFSSSMGSGLEDIDQPRQRINRQLKQVLPKGLAQRLSFSPLFDSDGNRVTQRVKRGGYAIGLQPGQIRILP